jgi:hypothetical protein
MDVNRLRARPCHGGAAVDLYDSRHPDAEVLHVAADEFAAFLSRAKAGEFDHLLPSSKEG